ncbi:MAG: hypothetical protein ACLTX3_08135 [Lachnospiraceae bacterium]
MKRQKFLTMLIWSLQEALRTAQADTAVAKNALDVAKNLAAEKAQAVTDAETAYQNAVSACQKARKLSLKEAMTTPITDADYTYLNAYVTKISDAKQAYDSGGERFGNCQGSNC